MPIILDDNVRKICRNFSICVNRHIAEDGDVVLLLHRFCVVFVPLVCRLHLKLLTDLPVYESVTGKRKWSNTQGMLWEEGMLRFQIDNWAKSIGKLQNAIAD